MMTCVHLEAIYLEASLTMMVGCPFNPAASCQTWDPLCRSVCDPAMLQLNEAWWGCSPMSPKIPLLAPTVRASPKAKVATLPPSEDMRYTARKMSHPRTSSTAGATVARA